jgi:predicted 3-demethylubiquinone-9 3-methyltransferase (glyoxalase superfamily)
MQKITPFLWFNDNAEEAMEFYTSVFSDSEIVNIIRHGDSVPDKAGKAITGTIKIGEQQFHFLNGGPIFNFTPAISFFINCETQEEIDYLWEKLSEGGEQSMCGWVIDKFGLSWQIIPSILGKLIGDSDPVKAMRVNEAMHKMNKMDIQKLIQAHSGE